MIISETHDIYKPGDFSEEEITRENVIAVAVLEDKEKVCKQCGDHGHQLTAICRKSAVWPTLSPEDQDFEEAVRKAGTGMNDDKS